ncbi:MAG: dihydrodipicolinate synthase family protein [Terriglobia bacterium]|jgi:4-hydroxy-tetrahydrodipicolinate synthase
MKHSISRRDFLLQASAGAAACCGPFASWRTGSALAVPAGTFRGIFAILQTPFNQDDQVDWDDLGREVNFCVRAGDHGVVWPQLAGEFYLLSEEERTRGADVVIHAAAGRTNVVIGVQAPSSGLALKFAQHAEAQGASALIALPPYMGSVGLESAGSYYHTLSQGVKLPIFIQNTGAPWGPALPTEFVIQMARESPQFAYIKEEVAPVARRIGEYARSGVMKGIFSGSAGRNLLDELSHGAAGTMPACQFTDVSVQIYDLATQGKIPEARAIFEKLLPMTNLEEIYGLPFMKEVLVRRGVFTTAKLRGVAGGGLDNLDRRELEEWWKELAPYLKA